MLPIRFEGHRNASGFHRAEDAGGLPMYAVRDVFAAEPLALEATDLENPVFLRLINCNSDADFIRYLDRHDVGPKLSTESMRHLRDEYAAAASRCLTGDAGSRLATANELLSRTALQPTLRWINGASRMVLSVASVSDFMKVEIAAAVVAGAALRSCEHCGDRFLVGPLTRRRVDTRFCADRCRVAAMRARNASKAPPAQ